MVLFWNNSWQANKIFWKHWGPFSLYFKETVFGDGNLNESCTKGNCELTFFFPIYVMICCWKKGFWPPVQKRVYSLTAYLTLCFHDLLEFQHFQGTVQMSNTKQLSATVMPSGQFDLNNNYSLWKGHFPSCSILSNFFPCIFSPQEPRTLQSQFLLPTFLWYLIHNTELLKRFSQLDLYFLCYTLTFCPPLLCPCEAPTASRSGAPSTTKMWIC